MPTRTAVAAPPADERDRLRRLLWKLLQKRLEHDWVRIDVGLSRCSKCGWGWKFYLDNNFPCPGFRIDAR